MQMNDSQRIPASKEAVPSPVAEQVTRRLHVPTIGIGAGAGTDGQVLVWHDLLGLYDGQSPRFVKRYADLASTIRDAVAAYAEDVRERRFPEEVHTYGMSEEERAAFEAAVGAGSQGSGEHGERRDQHRSEEQRTPDAAPRKA